MNFVRNVTAAGVIGLGYLGMSQPSNIGAQDKGGIVLPVLIYPSVDEFQDSKKFFDLMDNAIKKYGGVRVFQAPGINGKNIAKAEIALRWITNPKGGIQPDGTGIPARFKDTDSKYMRKLIASTASGMAVYYKSLGTEIGNKRAQEVGTIAKAYIDGANKEPSAPRVFDPAHIISTLQIQIPSLKENVIDKGKFDEETKTKLDEVYSSGKKYLDLVTKKGDKEEAFQSLTKMALAILDLLEKNEKFLGRDLIISIYANIREIRTNELRNPPPKKN